MSSLLAAVIMSYDEADLLPACLAPLQAAGIELHVSVDAQSTDNAAEIAAACGAQVYSHRGLPEEMPEGDSDKATEALNSYSRMRNEVLDQVCTRSQAPWLLWLDPDEIVAEGLDALLVALSTLGDDVQGVAVTVRLHEPDGRCLSVMRNSKVIRRDVRFTRRRHEHIVVTGAQALCADMVVEHRPTQRPEVREAHDKRKQDYDAYVADWAEFRDGRAAFYLGNWWNLAGHPWEALNWHELGLAMPPEKCIPIQRVQLAIFAGRLWLGLGDAAQARRCYLRALQEDVRTSEAAYYLGVGAQHEGKPQEAEVWFHLAELLPDDPCGMVQQELGCSRDLPYFGLAVVAAERRDFAEAYRLLDIAERRAPFPRAQYVELRKKLDRR